MSESDEQAAAGERATPRTDDEHACQRCNRKQGLVGKYDIWLCRQCFREMARGMGFKKYR